MEWSSILNRKAICLQWRLYDGTGDQRLSDRSWPRHDRMTGNCAPGCSTAEQGTPWAFRSFCYQTYVRSQESLGEITKRFSAFTHSASDGDLLRAYGTREGCVQNLSHIRSCNGFGFRYLPLIEWPHIHVALADHVVPVI